MTMHIAFACNAFLLQVGDRLVSQDVGRDSRDPWDPLANKTIVLVCADGRAIVSYAGLAHMDGISTDEWLLDVITEREPPPPPLFPGGGNGFRFGGPLNLRLWDVVTRTRDAIQRDLRRQLVRPQDKELEVLVSGWALPRGVYRRPSNRPTCFIYSLKSQARGTRPCLVTRHVRFRHAGRGRQIATVSCGARPTEDLRRFYMDRTGRGPETEDNVEQILVDFVRSEADQSSGAVGNNLMSCYLPLAGGSHIRYFRDASMIRPALAYTPTFVHAGGMIMPPAVLSGVGWSFGFGPEGYEESISIECIPPLADQGETSHMSSQGRPTP